MNHLIVPKGTKFTGSGKLGLTEYEYVCLESEYEYVPSKYTSEYFHLKYKSKCETCSFKI